MINKEILNKIILFIEKLCGLAVISGLFVFANIISGDDFKIQILSSKLLNLHFINENIKSIIITFYVAIGSLLLLLWCIEYIRGKRNTLLRLSIWIFSFHHAYLNWRIISIYEYYQDTFISLGFIKIKKIWSIEELRNRAITLFKESNLSTENLAVQIEILIKNAENSMEELQKLCSTYIYNLAEVLKRDQEILAEKLMQYAKEGNNIASIATSDETSHYFTNENVRKAYSVLFVIGCLVAGAYIIYKFLQGSSVDAAQSKVNHQALDVTKTHVDITQQVIDVLKDVEVANILQDIVTQVVIEKLKKYEILDLLRFTMESMTPAERTKFILNLVKAAKVELSPERVSMLLSHGNLLGR